MVKYDFVPIPVTYPCIFARMPVKSNSKSYIANS